MVFGQFVVDYSMIDWSSMRSVVIVQQLLVLLDRTKMLFDEIAMVLVDSVVLLFDCYSQMGLDVERHWQN